MSRSRIFYCSFVVFRDNVAVLVQELSLRVVYTTSLWRKVQPGQKLRPLEILSTPKMSKGHKYDFFLYSIKQKYIFYEDFYKIMLSVMGSFH